MPRPSVSLLVPAAFLDGRRAPDQPASRSATWADMAATWIEQREANSAAHPSRGDRPAGRMTLRRSS
jgi:hypothetical protein